MILSDYRRLPEIQVRRMAQGQTDAPYVRQSVDVPDIAEAPVAVPLPSETCHQEAPALRCFRTLSIHRLATSTRHRQNKEMYRLQNYLWFCRARNKQGLPHGDMIQLPIFPLTCHLPPQSPATHHENQNCTYSLFTSILKKLLISEIFLSWWRILCNGWISYWWNILNIRKSHLLTKLPCNPRKNILPPLVRLNATAERMPFLRIWLVRTFFTRWTLNKIHLPPIIEPNHLTRYIKLCECLLLIEITKPCFLQSATG